MPRRASAIPLRRDDGSVTVAVADPQSDDVRTGVEAAVRERVRFVIAPASDIERAINNCYRALDGVSLTVPRGCVFGLVGAYGAGMTTLIRHLLGLLRPTCGAVRVFGRDPVSDPAGENSLGYSVR